MKVIRLTPDRIDQAVELANRVFRSKGGSMLEDYPLLFSPQNSKNILAVEEDGKIVSIFGLLFREIQIFSARLKTVLVGSVCTDEKYRGRGYATALMNEAGKISIQNGSSLILISGDNSVYKKFGAVDAGIYNVHLVEGESIVKYRDATLKDVDLLTYLHSINPVRFVRDKKIFETMIKTSKADNMPAKIFLSGSSYVVITEGVVEKDEQKRYHCVDHGGCQTDVADLVKSVAIDFNPMILHTILSDCVLNRIFESNQSQKRRFIGTVKILDKEMFLKQVKPYSDERPFEGVEEITDLSKLTTYIFGSSEESKHLKWPLPLPDYGMDYV